MPKISVIIPVYNAGKYLKKCISSIVNQTMQDIEIIVVDDGSTDNSLNILNELSKKYRLNIYTKEHSGAGSARNVGLDNATGEYIMFVDADDYLKEDILEKMYNIAKKYNVSLVIGNYQTILGPIKMKDQNNWSNIKGSQIVEVSKNKDFILTETPGIGNKLISRKLIGNLRFPEKTKWEDLAIMPVIIASSKKLFYMDEPVYNYRICMNTTIKDFIYKISNILDIIKSVENIETQMQKRGLYEEYKSQIESLYILHTLFRVENTMFWINFPRKKKKIVISSLLAILDKKYPNWINNKMVNLYRTKNSLFNFDMKKLNKYSVSEYRNVKRKEAENNIKEILL